MLPQETDFDKVCQKLQPLNPSGRLYYGYDHNSTTQLAQNPDHSSLTHLSAVPRHLQQNDHSSLTHLPATSHQQNHLSAIPKHLKNITRSHNHIAHLPSDQDTSYFLSMVAIPSSKSHAHIPTRTYHRHAHRHHLRDRPLLRKDLFYSGSVYKLNSSLHPSVNDMYHDKISFTSVDSDATIKSCLDLEEFTEGLHIVTGLSLLKKPLFLLCIVMGVLWTSRYEL